MKTVTIDAITEAEAITTCKEQYGWTPAAVREVDSGDEGTRAFKCFESGDDADIWDNQK